MECYICDPTTDQENQCSYHSVELDPLSRFMAEFTGCSHFTQSNNPFMNLDSHHADLVVAFIAGARLRLKLIKIKGVNMYRLTDSDEIYFDYASVDEMP